MPVSATSSASMKDESLQYLHGVGPKRAAILASLGIRTIHDLFYYFPRNYLDRSHITKIKDLRRLLYADHDVTVVGKVLAMDVVRGRGGTKRFIFVLNDETGSLECVFFGGIQWFQKMFRLNEVLAVSGRPAMYGGRLQFVHPEFDRLSLDAEEEGGGGW